MCLILELIPKEELEALMEAVAKATGGGLVVLDGKYSRITESVGGHRACMKLIRELPGQDAACLGRDGARAKATRAAWESGNRDIDVSRCERSGLYDFCIPIAVDPYGLVGFLLCGQIMADEDRNNHELFRACAKVFALDEDEYLEALKENPVLPKERIEGLARLLQRIVTTLCESAAARRTDQALMRVSQAVVATFSLEGFLPQVVEAADEVVGLTTATIWIERGGRLVSEHTRGGLPERNPEAYFHLTPDEVGWVAKVARERKGIVVPDLLAEPPEKFKYYEHVQRLETHSYCAVPMLAGDRLIGVFEIGHRETGRYDGSDLAVLEHLAASVSMAVHTVRLHETLQGDLKRVTADRDRRRVLMDAVAQVDSALNAEVSDEEVFRRLLNQVLGLLRQHAAMVWGHVRKTDETGQGAYLVHDGSDGPYRDAISPYRLVGSHVSGHILTSGETDIWRERPASDPQLAAMIKEARREGSESTAEFLERIEWLIGWPLKARDGVVGTLCVYGPEPYSIPDEVLYTAGLLVAHGAVAIGLAQMRGTYDMRGQVRDVVLHAAQGLSQDIDVKRLLQHVCQAARAMLGADVAVYGCRRVETDGHGYELVAWDVPAGAAAPRGGTVDLPHEPLGREVWLIRDHAELLYRAFGEGVRSALLAPLRYRYGGGKVPQGVLIAESVKPSKFEEREVEALKVLASAAGSHLERAVAVTTEWDWLVHKLRHPMALAQHLIELCTEPTEESAPGLALAPSREVVRGAQAAIDLFNATDTGVSFLALREREDYATEFRLVDLPDLVQHVCRLAEAPLETRKVPCTVEPSAAGVRVKGHAGALRSILYEVISNALQNDPAGNYDPKSIPPIEVTVSRVADRARVAVKDSGPPLNKEQADRVFARHVALRAGGGGLGLFIVQAVVAAHEGRTWVEPLDSSPKSFVVEVPVAPGPDTNRDATLGQPDSAVGP